MQIQLNPHLHVNVAVISLNWILLTNEIYTMNKNKHYLSPEAQVLELLMEGAVMAGSSENLYDLESENLYVEEF